MKPSNHTLLVLLTVAHFLLGILSGSLGWENQLLVVSISGIVVTWIIFKKYHGSFLKIWIAILPFYIFYSASSIYLRSYVTYPIWIVGLTGCLVTYLSLKALDSLPLQLAMVSILPLLGFFIIMPNNFAYQFQKPDPAKYNLTESRIKDESGESFDINSFRGKVTLVDIWNTACIPCIKKFPDLQKLHNRYENDSNIKIITLNIPLSRDKGKRPERFTDPYSFGKYYFENEAEAEKLSIREVPLILILDKELNCRFAGDLNTGKLILIGNAEKIIDRLKSE